MVEEIREIAAKFRERAGLPKEPTGEVSQESAGLLETLQGHWVLADIDARKQAGDGRPAGQREKNQRTEQKSREFWTTRRFHRFMAAFNGTYDNASRFRAH